MKEEIYKEIESIAPKLSEINNRNPFRVPDNYFEDLQVKLNKEKGITDSIPNDYFDHLSDRIWSKYGDELRNSSNLIVKKNVNKSLKIYSLNHSILSKIAASVVIIIVSTLYFNWNGAVRNEVLNYNSIETEEMISFLEDDDQANETEIFEIFESVLNTDLEFSNDLSDMELSKYLEDNIDDYEDDIL